jgi:Fe-S-cluster-containing dehydrogenase component
MEPTLGRDRSGATEDAQKTRGPQPDRAAAVGRRQALKILAAGSAALGGASVVAQVAEEPSAAGDGSEYTMMDRLGEAFQDHYQRMTPEEIQNAIERLERKYKAQHGVDVQVGDTPPIPGVVFGYALNLNKCKGYRECVSACVRENNQSRDPEVQYIRVLELDRDSMNLEESDHYYDHEVPAPGKAYMPVQCHQCENPPCVAACPVEATWTEPDGVIVVDYNWCIGCRYCMTACPYWARRFNWTEPGLPVDEINVTTDYLSNRPRPSGVVEKCTFCLHRTRKGLMPACQEACPTGARVFGNLLDPNSEIRYILENLPVFRLKEDLNTEPKFWYYFD